MKYEVFMEGLKKLKKFAAEHGKVWLRVASAACAAALVGAAVNFNTSDNSKLPKTVNPRQETVTVQQTRQTQKLTMINFKKAPLSDYDMTLTQIRPTTDNKKTDTVDFKIAPENKTFSYIDKMDPSSPLYASRDTSNEFFTVRDITTGKLVTMNAYDLVCSIVYNEVGDGWGTEAIKAQAVAAYSCLRFSDNIGMIETVGIKKNYTQRIENCVRAVQGQAVTYKGSIANTLYSASTAGYSIPSSDVFVLNCPYLTCVKSAYDNKDPNWGVKVSYTTAQVKKALEDKFKIKLSDDLKNWFKITDSRYGKYIFGVSVDSKVKTTGKAIAELFKLKSNAFDISYSNGKFTFTTYGWGHAVGMSQWGACLYARKGYTYDQILTHYYVGTRLSLSSVSQKAVERGKKTSEELEKEAQTATQTVTQSSADETDNTSFSHTQETQQTLTDTDLQITTTAPVSEPDKESSAKNEQTTAAKVTKSAERAE